MTTKRKKPPELRHSDGLKETKSIRTIPAPASQGKKRGRRRFVPRSRASAHRKITITALFSNKAKGKQPMKFKLKKPQPNHTRIGVSFTAPKDFVDPMDVRARACGMNRSRYLSHLIRLDLEELGIRVPAKPKLLPPTTGDTP